MIETKPQTKEGQMRVMMFTLAVWLVATSTDADLPLLEVHPLPYCCATVPTIVGVPLPPAPPMTKRELVNYVFDEQTMKEYWLENFSDIEKAKATVDSDGNPIEPELVQVPLVSTEIGYRLRTTGRFPIGEAIRDPKKRMELLPLLTLLRKEGAGALFLVASRYKKQHIDEFGFAPPLLESSSLVRPWAYQKLLMKSNPNANTIRQGVPPTHVTALSHDIARGPLNERQDEILYEVLAKAEEEGILIFFREGQLNPRTKRVKGGGQFAFHVIAVPARTAELTAVYSELIQASASTAVAGSQP